MHFYIEYYPTKYKHYTIEYGGVVMRGRIASVFCFLIAGCALAYPNPANANGPWTGTFVGGHLGGLQADLAYNRSFLPDFPGFTERVDISDGGFVGGFHLAAQYQAGDFVFGVEGALSVGGIDTQVPLRLQGNLGNERAEISTLAALAFRLGYTFNPNLLAYVKAGYAGADVTAQLVGISNLAASETGIIESWEHGLLFGAGFEFYLSSYLVLGIEYNYYDIGLDDRANNILTNNNPTQLSDGELTLQSFLVRISVKL